MPDEPTSKPIPPELLPLYHAARKLAATKARKARLEEAHAYLSRMSVQFGKRHAEPDAPIDPPPLIPSEATKVVVLKIVAELFPAYANDPRWRGSLFGGEDE